MHKVGPLLILVAFLGGCATNSRQSQVDGPLGQLEQLKNYETRRVSSCKPDWRNQNQDSIPIEPGATAVIADLQGPGKIVHIWFTVFHVDPHYASKLTLRMYWDGEEHPSVECPLGDFFGVGMGMNVSFASLPIRVSAEGRARNCYWPMPFRKSARITITNESDQPCRSVYYYVDWQKHKSIPADAAYFHAMYRQEFPCVMGTNYLFADIKGRGHYVGTVQSVYHTSDGWYGEGDDFFFIDGEEEPSLRGTGTEDYFCDAWGFRQQEGPFYGIPVWEGMFAGKRGSAYRFHIPDPVTFRKSLRVEIEHKGSEDFPDKTRTGFIERDDMMSSVAFWYQTEPHKPWPALPAGVDRVPYTLRPVVAGVDAVPTAKHSAHTVEVQNLRGRNARQQLWFRPTTQEDAWVEVPFQVEEAVTGDMVLALTHAADYGLYRVSLNGQRLGTFDLFNPATIRQEHLLGRHKLAPGTHVLRFECVGKNEDSRGFLLGFEKLTARVPRYLRPEGKDLRDLQVTPFVP
jgi:hypothetical protein